MLNQQLFEAKKNSLVFYSPFNFLRQLSSDQLLGPIHQELNQWGKENQLFFENENVQFFCSYLIWDSDFFGKKTCKINYILHESAFQNLTKACVAFLAWLKSEGYEYIFMEIPPEDILLIQSLNLAGLKLTETRLIYFNDQVAGFESPRFRVRKATEVDIPNLRKVSAGMRNNFDRFHADPNIDQQAGDQFLARYVEESVKGFTDVVLVPDEPSLPSDSFFTANLMKNVWESIGVRVSKIVLTAASSETNRGWHAKLMSETTLWLKAQGSEVVYMPTQSTNRAVIRNCEKIGYRYGCSMHVLTSSL